MSDKSNASTLKDVSMGQLSDLRTWVIRNDSALPVYVATAPAGGERVKKLVASKTGFCIPLGVHMLLTAKDGEMITFVETDQPDTEQ